MQDYYELLQEDGSDDYDDISNSDEENAQEASEQINEEMSQILEREEVKQELADLKDSEVEEYGQEKGEEYI
jgi:hypothetical protein